MTRATLGEQPSLYIKYSLPFISANSIAPAFRSEPAGWPNILKLHKAASRISESPEVFGYAMRTFSTTSFVYLPGNAATATGVLKVTITLPGPINRAKYGNDDVSARRTFFCHTRSPKNGAIFSEAKLPATITTVWPSFRCGFNARMKNF